MTKGPNLSGLALAGLVAALIWIAPACEDSSPNYGTPAATDTPGAVNTDTPTDVGATATTGESGIREVNFSTQADVSGFITQNGGEVDATAIIYADLTGDGAEEAIVPVSSGGTLGNLAVFVFSYDSYGPAILLKIEPAAANGITADLQEGQLFTDEAAYGPNDPQCCPSQIVRRYYVWNGSALVVDREEQIAATPGVR